MVRTARTQQHPDLFWAARGGGRGLGVATSFEFNLRSLGPDVTAAQVVYDLDDANRPNEDSFLVIRTLGGAISRVQPEDRAYRTATPAST